MDNHIKFDDQHNAEVRVIGKQNVVLSLHIDDKFVGQINMRKIRGKWILKVKKCAPGYEAGSKGWFVAREKKLIDRVEEFLVNLQVEKLLLT